MTLISNASTRNSDGRHHLRTMKLRMYMAQASYLSPYRAVRLCQIRLFVCMPFLHIIELRTYVNYRRCIPHPIPVRVPSPRATDSRSIAVCFCDLTGIYFLLSYPCSINSPSTAILSTTTYICVRCAVVRELVARPSSLLAYVCATYIYTDNSSILLLLYTTRDAQ